MADHKLTRRQFVQQGTLASAGIAFGLSATKTVHAGNPEMEDTTSIPSYSPEMEYRRCGKTEMMVSAVCLGGHWKRMDKILGPKSEGKGWLAWGAGDAEFNRNRREVVSRCIDRGVNYIDACWSNEVIAYSKALEGRRDKMFLGYSWGHTEVRYPEWRTFEALKKGFEDGLRTAKQEYVDLWRITCLEQSSQHDEATIEELIKALDWAKQKGLARFTGISSHDRPHIKVLIEKYPDQLEVICTPYTAKTKVVADETGLWSSMKKHDVGWFGIKPFASNSVFKGDSSPGNPHEEEDNRIARLAIRYILCNPAITAPIPGLVTVEQVDNMALAIKERRVLDLEEKAELDRAMERAWANLPSRYQWLKEWEYV